MIRGCISTVIGVPLNMANIHETAARGGDGGRFDQLAIKMQRVHSRDQNQNHPSRNLTYCAKDNERKVDLQK